MTSDKGLAPSSPLASSASATHDPGRGVSEGIKARLRHEFERFLLMFAYLFAILVLLQIHEYIILAQHHIAFHKYGFALVNALVFAKFMLIADNYQPFARFRAGRPLLHPILFRSVGFAVLFILCDIGEKVLVGAIHGVGPSQSLPTFGGGGWLGSFLVGVILSISLLPFFAFDEINRALGPGKLAAMVLRHGAAPIAPATPTA